MRASRAPWHRWPGWKQALHRRRPAAIDLAVRRILLLHSVILSIGGIPLIYLGDEVGTLNDYAYANDPAKAGDSRWVHRPATDWQQMARRHDRPPSKAAFIMRCAT